MAGDDLERVVIDGLLQELVEKSMLTVVSGPFGWAERILAVTPPTDEDETVYWLVCATYGYKQNGDHQAYQRLVDR